MPRRFIALLLSLCWLVLSPAWGADRGALFLVTANGHTMHLFGTMHVGLDEFYPLEPRITEAITHASTVALEMDPDQPQAVLIQALQQYGLRRAGAPGYESLPAEERARVERLVRASGMDASRAASYKPVLLACMLALAEYTKLGYRPELSAEAFIARLARSSKARILALESASLQLALLDELTLADQWRFLNETAASIESGSQREQALKVARAWSTADSATLDTVEEGIASDNSVSGKFAREVMIEGRNGVLADKLANLLSREQHTVAAIGVLHLLGKNGVPALLRARGIEVVRVY